MGRRRSGAIRYSDVESLKQADVRRTGRNRHVLFALRVFALAALIVAFSRPQTGVTNETGSAEGIDIVLAIDVSSSMLAEDLEPNRLEAAKAVAADFVVENLDATIVAQAPRLAAHLSKMEGVIADVLGVGPDRVNVKVTSTDGLGAIGRGEGIAAQAVVLIARPPA